MALTNKTLKCRIRHHLRSGILLVTGDNRLMLGNNLLEQMDIAVDNCLCQFFATLQFCKVSESGETPLSWHNCQPWLGNWEYSAILPFPRRSREL